MALRALISRGNSQKWRTEIRIDDALSDSSTDQTERNSLSVQSQRSSNAIHEDKQIDQIIDVSLENCLRKVLEEHFLILYYINQHLYALHIEILFSVL